MSAFHSLLCDGILNGEAGDTLLTVLSVGVDFLNQKSFECGSGNGASVSSVQIVKLGLAVLDRLLIKNKEAEMSLLESKVCDAWALHNSSESQFFRPFESSFVSNIAKYIYHEDDPKLATLAMVVLQRICFINSVSIIACFGSDAFSLRRAIVSCLESNTKPVRLKVAILEFLTCAVDKQPGLLELFINHQLQTGEESLKSKKTFGKPSCLPAVLNYLAVKPNAQPKPLRLAALRFVHALWISRMDPVLSVVRKSENFWSNLVVTLAVTETETLSFDDVNVLTLLLKVFAMEAFTMTSSVDVSSELQGAIENMQSYNFHKAIKHAIVNSSLADAKRKEQTIANTCSLIRSWTEFTMVTSSVQSKKAKSDDEKMKHFLETLSLFTSEVDKKVGEELSFAVLVLARQWSGSLSNVTRLETEIITLIEMVCNEDDKSLCFVQDHLFSAMLILSSRCVESPDNAELVYNKWLAMLRLICQIIEEISVTVTSCYRPAHYKRLLLMINLVSIASRRFKDSTHLLHIFEEHSVFRHLMNVLGSIKKEPSQKNLVSEILSLSLVFARDSELVAIVLRNDFLRLLVVEWNWGYIASPYGNDTDCEHWTIAIALVTTLLKTTSHKVLDAAISFIAANKARIIEATKLNCRIKSEALLKESKETSKLFLQLSYFWNKLASMEPELMESLKFEAMMMLHSSVSFLARPRLLQHIVEDRESMQVLLEKSRAPSPSLSTDSRHNLQLKEETYYNLDEPLGRVQEMIIEIVASTTGMIRNISPNLVESIIDEGADLQNFVPTVQLAFSFPSFDELREVSFGTFIASINVCHKILMQTAESATVSPLQESNLFDSHRNKVLRNILNFVIENSVVIIMSEASFYLRHQTINPRTKQFMKRELGSELKNLLHSINRSQSRKVVSQVSKSSGRESPTALRRNASITTFSENESDNIYEIAYAFACQLLK
ncbi:nucleoporin NUP188-like [Rhopilema esculentum]|uniref:nucleoporin NUP188-like n=1 Tax=Rhopilema esculentum TaxID=499914 RepID=UPI0031E1CE58